MGGLGQNLKSEMGPRFGPLASEICYRPLSPGIRELAGTHVRHVRERNRTARFPLTNSPRRRSAAFRSVALLTPNAGAASFLEAVIELPNREPTNSPDLVERQEGSILMTQWTNHRRTDVLRASPDRPRGIVSISLPEDHRIAALSSPRRSIKRQMTRKPPCVSTIRRDSGILGTSAQSCIPSVQCSERVMRPKENSRTTHPTIHDGRQWDHTTPCPRPSAFQQLNPRNPRRLPLRSPAPRQSPDGP